MAEKKFIRVVNWERFQHYKHRNPPWIKLYGEMLSSRTWVTLDDSSRVLAFAVLMLAARHENKIPMDPDYIRRVAYLNSDPNFDGLLETNFVEIVDGASNVLATCTHDASNLHQNALPETEKRQSREETELEAERRSASSSATSSANGSANSVPNDLHPLNYAAKICGELGLPQERTNLQAFASAIEALVKKGKNPPAAFEFLLARAKDAQESGELAHPVFWCRDGSYNTPATQRRTRGDSEAEAFLARHGTKGKP
jgi:hypothetical protein